MHHYFHAFQLRCESQMLDNCLVFFKEHDKTPEGGKNIYFAHFVIRKEWLWRVLLETKISFLYFTSFKKIGIVMVLSFSLVQTLFFFVVP